MLWHICENITESIAVSTVSANVKPKTLESIKEQIYWIKEMLKKKMNHTFIAQLCSADCLSLFSFIMLYNHSFLSPQLSNHPALLLCSNNLQYIKFTRYSAVTKMKLV